MIGFEVFDVDGSSMVKVGRHNVGNTNNESELLALKQALEFVVEHGWKYRGKYILVQGDS